MNYHRCSRRDFLANSSTLVAMGAALPSAILVCDADAQDSPASGDANPVDKMLAQMRAQKGPPLDEALAKEFVYWAHTDLEKVKASLEREPRIINCTLDWGGGDHETALGGASHMGRRDIALCLLDHNARMDIFAATMLGRLDVVKAALTAYPKLLHTPGPHGIPLIKHAQAGGEEAKAVLEYLRAMESASP
jgi:hypothetical protein